MAVSIEARPRQTPRLGPVGTALRYARSLHLDDAWLLGLMSAAVAVRLIFWIYTNRIWEDALITVLHSENFYRGLGLTHFRIDDPRPLHGFTSPISVLAPLLADRFHIGWGLPFQKLLSLFAAPAGVWFAYRILMDYLVPASRAAAVLGAGYLAFEHHQILWGMAGMESQIAVAVLLASFYFLLNGEAIATGVATGLCLLARPDFVLWALIAAIAVAHQSYCRRSVMHLVRFVVPVCLIYSPWLVFTTAYYGSPIPNTVIAKSLGYVGFWEVTPLLWPFCRTAAWIFIHQVCAPLEPVFGGNGTGFIPLVSGYTLIEVCLVFVVIGFCLDLVRRDYRFIPIYACAAVLSAFLTFRAPVIFGWYAVPVCATLALLLAKSIAQLTVFIPPKQFKIVLWVVCLGYVGVFAAVLPFTFRFERNIQDLVENKIRRQIGIYLSHTPTNTTIAGEPLGYVGYYSRRTYYDYPGLCSRKVVSWLKTHKYPRVWKQLQLYAYLRPDYLVLRRSEYLRFHTQPEGKFLDTNYHLDREFQITPKDKQKLFRPDRNIDLDFMLLVRNDRGQHST